jgi:hypothetical protein
MDARLAVTPKQLNGPFTNSIFKFGARRIKEETFQTYLQSLTATDDTDYSLWKATKRLKQPTQRIPPIRKTDQTWARNAKEKANDFAAHLEKVFKPIEMSHNEEF